MKLIIDANILFSAFLKDGLTRRIIIYNFFELYTPKYILEEFFEHIAELAKKSKVNKEIMKSNIKEFISSSGIKLYSKKDMQDFIGKAKIISPDNDDVMYFAAALKLNCPIWSNDKKLREQNKIKIHSTKEILDIIRQTE